MRRIQLLYIVVCLAVFSLGCNKILDVENISAFDPKKVWNDPQLTNAYLTDLYRRTMPGEWPVNNGGNADELAGILEAGAVQVNNGSFKVWPYDKIRDINILLEEIDKGALEAKVKDPVKGQAYFLRAWNYFNAVMTHGGVPILTKAQGIKDDLQVPRNSTKECFEFIEADLQQALALLPTKFSGADRGRVDKPAVLAFLGRVLLYKASPLFNPSNPYNNTYWATAYTANKKAKDDLAAQGYALMNTYGAMFNKANEGNSETVLSVLFMKPNRSNGRREDMCRPLSESKNATGGDQPIWEMVEAFPMKDGLQPGSSAYPYNVQTYWENRDPRFYVNVVYNGSVYELSGKSGRRQYTMQGIATNEDMFGPGQLFNRTGFYPLKGLDPTLLQPVVTENDLDWVEIRYAEVLLNFAEAANETGRSAEALDVLVQIRKRAGIEPGGSNLYGLSAGMTREQLRDAIYHERRIEFIYEGKRFTDLRRARKFAQLNGMKKHGLLATLKAGKNPGDGAAYLLQPQDFTYQVVPLISNGTNVMSVPDSYYFFPIAQSEIEKNPKLIQNAGWNNGTFNPTLE